VSLCSHKLQIVQGTRWDKENKVRADITYATDDTKSNFVAETPAGEAFLGGPELTIPNDQADECLAKAIAAGLSVLPFP
jgi:hypothetical protein